MSVGDPPQVSMRERLAQDYAWTPRQREVLQLIAAGKTNTEIAEMLGLSLAGAKWHVSEILSKLQAESREEAAEYWRRQSGIAPRFARVFRGFSGGMAPKWVAGSLAGVATVAAVGIALLVVAWQGGEDAPVVPPSNAEASPTVPSTPATASVTPQATATPRPAGSPPQYAGAPRRVLIPRGGPVNAERGVLFLDAATGGGEFWQLPDGGFGSRISADGRYIAWSEVTVPNAHIQVAHILDTSTGIDRISEFAGQSLQPDRFSPDGTRFVGLAGRSIVAAESASGKVLQVHTVEGTKPELYLQAEWSPDGTDFVAGVSGGESTWLVADGSGRSMPVSLRGIEWSHDGTRVALSSPTGTLIVSLDGSRDVPLQMGASNPRWSFDDKYLALNLLDLNVGTDMLVFDSRTGAPVLKVNGTGTCFGDYWVPGESAVKGQFEAKNKVLVPSGELAAFAQFATGWNSSDGSSLEFRSEASALVKNGQTLAEVAGHGSVPYVSDQLDIFHGGRPAMLVGLGGKGLCGEGTTPPFEVQKPPFPD